MQIQRIYVDGACRGNGRYKMPMAGIGVYYGDQDQRNHHAPLICVDDVERYKPTNQRAELWAFWLAMDDIVHDIDEGRCDCPTTIYTDSSYVFNVVSTWRRQWEQNGWRNSRGQRVKNRDIMKSMRKQIRIIDDYYVKYGWALDVSLVPGHSGDRGNDRADFLAKLGADLMESVVYEGDDNSDSYFYGTFHRGRFEPLGPHPFYD